MPQKTKAASRTSKRSTSKSRSKKTTSRKSASKRASASSSSRRSTRTSSSRTRTSLDAVALLKNDHRMVEGLFKKFEAAPKRNLKAKGKLRDEIVRELSIHAAIEEQILYPAARERARQEGLVLESLEEHHLVKVLLAEIDGMDPEEERFEPKVHVLMENVQHHVKEEEQELLPKVRKVLSRGELIELGEQMAEAKKSAPTHPHPSAPDEPPGITIAGPVSAVMDSVKDVVRGTRQAVGEVLRGEEPEEL